MIWAFKMINFLREELQLFSKIIESHYLMILSNSFYDFVTGLNDLGRRSGNP
jgi:hypothetical protein